MYRSYYNHLVVLKPYLNQITNGNALNFTDLWLAHVHFHPSTTLYMDKISHMIPVVTFAENWRLVSIIR